VERPETSKDINPERIRLNNMGAYFLGIMMGLKNEKGLWLYSMSQVA
jgi:hypothetical protein